MGAKDRKSNRVEAKVVEKPDKATLQIFVIEQAESIPPHVGEDVAVRCTLEAGFEIKAVAYMYKSDYCEIKSLESDNCACRGLELSSVGYCVWQRQRSARISELGGRSR